jgi:hypothetical protein
MNAKFLYNGFSARRKAVDRIQKPTRTAAWIFFITAALVLISCHENSSGQTEANKHKSVAAQDSLSKPRVSINVNRRYDDKGNLIGVDSTYSSFYSNIEGDTSRMDSLMSSFDRFFDQHHAWDFNHRFNTLFFNDSLRYPDFFHNDFFMKRYELNDPFIRSMMQRMDSIKNEFYREHRDLKGPQKKKSTT